MEDNKSWLENLKAGDEVFISKKYSGIPSIEKAARVTATRIMIKVNENYEEIYKKKDGRLIGNTEPFTSIYLIEPNEKDRHKITINRLQCKVRSLVDKLVIPSDENHLAELIAVLGKFTK